MMRGAFSEMSGFRQDTQMRQVASISNSTEDELTPARVDAVARAGFPYPHSFNFFLFCLTGVAIFDNRHGLLKKLDSVRTAKPLSEPLSHKSKC